MENAHPPGFANGPCANTWGRHNTQKPLVVYSILFYPALGRKNAPPWLGSALSERYMAATPRLRSDAVLSEVMIKVRNVSRPSGGFQTGQINIMGLVAVNPVVCSLPDIAAVGYSGRASTASQTAARTQ